MTTLSFRQGASGYAGTVDTVLKQANPTLTYAANTALYADGGAGANLQSLLMFKGLFGTGPGQIPAGATITSATLTVETTNATGGSASLHRMLFDWTGASSWSWNGFGAGIQTDGVEAASTADVTTGKVALGTRDFDVTGTVQAWAAGAGNFGWVVRTSSTDSWAFASAEGTVKPTLTVTYTTGSTPAVSAVVQKGSVTEGGATDSLSVALSTAPAQDVVVTIVDTADVSAAPLSLTFTPANWSTPQAVQLTATDDTLVEGTETSTLRLSVSSADPQYDGLAVTPVSLTVLDNDAPPPSPVPPVSATVVNIIDTTRYKTGDPSGYGIGDPSGLTYVPGLNALFIADSEHDESPYYSTTNLWSVHPDGGPINAFSMRSFTREPTGLAYNPLNGYLYVTDDDKAKVFWVDPANPGVKVGEFSLTSLGIADAEDPEIDPETGHIYMLDGLSRSLFELGPTGAFIRSFTLPSAVTDAEGLAYSAQHDVFFVSSGPTRGTIFEIDGNGTLLDTINTLNGSAYYNPAYGARPYLKGLELAPSSNPDDGGRLSLYAVDYGKDQRNDGRLFELDLGSGWTSGNTLLADASTTAEPDAQLAASLLEAGPDVFGSGQQRHHSNLDTNLAGAFGDDLPPPTTQIA